MPGQGLQQAAHSQRIALCHTILRDGEQNHRNGEPDWHCLTAKEVAQRLETSLDTGLTFKRAKQNLKAAGPNELSAGPVRSRAEILAEQFSGAPFVMLGLAAAISLISGAVLEAGAIGAVLLVNAAIGYATEQRAEAVVASPGGATAEPVEVLRDGAVHAIAPRDLVPGDVMLLRRGDVVKADARLIRLQDLSVSEAAIDGGKPACP